MPARMITGDMVVNGKPHPEPYMRGAEILGFSPQDCIVVEDAPAGVGAGRAAGSRVLAVMGSYPIEDLHQADWVLGRLSGRYDVSDENNALKSGYDPVRREWPDWIGVPRALLPRVQPPGTPVAPVLPEIAARFGLPAGTIAATGTTDGCAAFLATSADQPGDGVTSLGSTLTIKLFSDTPVFAPEFGIYSHRLGDRWLPGGASNTGGAALARHFDSAMLTRLSALIDPARDSGLDYYPLPNPGERFPVADPRLEPREAPRPDDDVAFLHGLLEGIARIEALAYQRLAELGAPPLRTLRTVGGGARNSTWTALRARLLGVPFADALSDEAAVGTAGLALQALALQALA